MQLQEIVLKFDIQGDLISVKPVGNGLINHTYLALFNENGTEKKYLLQQINTFAFPRVKELMSNIVGVTKYLADRVKMRGGDPDREVMTVVYTKDGQPYYHTEDDKYYRVYIFIDNSIAYEKVENTEQFYELGLAFGSFANQLSEYDVSILYDHTPGFHDTLKRYNNFLEKEKIDVAKRKQSALEECNFAHSRENYASKVVNLIKSGDIPVRVTHNDTKLNNVLFDKTTKKPLAVLDFDTILPGSILYDYGDAIRFGCSTASENEKDLSKVNFDFELFKAFTKGYVEELGDKMTVAEKENLAFSAILITYELGIRFLADYLDGDKYFHTSYEDENLIRARTQFKMVTIMEKLLPEMQEYINSL